MITYIKHLAQCLAQSWQTLFLIYFRFVSCLVCPEFRTEMKCETTLGGLEITQSLLLRDHKEDSREKVYLLLPAFSVHPVWWNSATSPAMINAVSQNELFFFLRDLESNIFFLSWPKYFQFGMTLVSI